MLVSRFDIIMLIETIHWVLSYNNIKPSNTVSIPVQFEI
jgi:hypothetical protein